MFINSYFVEVFIRICLLFAFILYARTYIPPFESIYQFYTKKPVIPSPNRPGTDLRLSQESPLAILHELREVEDTLGILLHLGRSLWEAITGFEMC